MSSMICVTLQRLLRDGNNNKQNNLVVPHSPKVI